VVLHGQLLNRHKMKKRNDMQLNRNGSLRAWQWFNPPPPTTQPACLAVLKGLNMTQIVQLVRLASEASLSPPARDSANV
jgi:hypothetical protein